MTITETITEAYPHLRTFLDRARAGDLVHATLLVGPAGVGKAELVDRAARLLTNQVEEGGAPAQQHPDVHWLDSEGKRGIAQVRTFTNALHQRPYQASRNVGVIERIDSLSRPAANALLKTIEEPPASATLILTADNLRNVLPTLRSRSQIIHVPPLTPDALADVFANTSLSNAAFWATQGLPAQALQWSENPEAYERYRDIVRRWGELLKEPLAVRATQAKAWSEEKDSIALEGGVLWLTTLLRSRAQPGNLPATAQAFLDEVGSLLESWHTVPRTNIIRGIAILLPLLGATMSPTQRRLALEDFLLTTLPTS